MHRVVAAAAVLAGLAAGPAWADDVAAEVQDAGGALAHGDALHALSALQAAEGALAAQLTDSFARALPPPPSGWDAAMPDDPPLDMAGGGFTLSRGYQKADSSLTALVVVDNPAVTAAIALFQPGNAASATSEWSRLSVGGQPALLRFDSTMNEGEILIVLDGRALLEIDGDAIASKSVLVDAAKGWDIAALHRLLAASGS